MKATLHKWKLWLYDLLWVNRCALCDELIEVQEILCPNCCKKLKEEMKRPLKRKAETNKLLSSLDVAYSLRKYDGALREGILNLKYAGKRDFGFWFGEQLAEVFSEQISHCDAVIPVPMTRKKQKKRGYNQAQILAEAIHQKLDIPLIEDALLHLKTKQEQHQLNQKERMTQSRSAFLAGNIKIPEKILLCDDIITTGATAEICAELLKKQGAKEVILVTIASTERE